MNKKDDKQNNRALTSNELCCLFEKLGINLRTINKNDLRTILNSGSNKFGNPSDKQSMIDFTQLLLKLQVDVWDEKNRRIIDYFIYNKPELVEDDVKEKEKLSEGVINKNNSLEHYIINVMLELGFKPYLSGFQIFKEGVLYLLDVDNKVELLWTKVVYPDLGKKNGISAAHVERVLRNIVDVACDEHPDNKACLCVFGNSRHLTVSECLCSVTDYVRVNYNSSLLKDCVINGNNNQISWDNGVYLEQSVSSILNQLGILCNLKGYYYLRAAILLMLVDYGNICCEEVYTYIADIYSTSSSKVGRCIRNAVLKFKEKYNKYLSGEFNIDKATEVEHFIYRYSYSSGNSEFIALVVEYIRLNFDRSILDDYVAQNRTDINKKVRRK